MEKKKTAIIIGAGPAGLTAAYELLKNTNIQPIIIEKSNEIGGLSRTVNYNGNLIDIGGHRFFSKSDEIMNWWQNMMPIEETTDERVKLSYQNKNKIVRVNSSKEKNNDNNKDVFLIRNRKSRIFFLGVFFNYPLQLNFDTFRKIGLLRSLKIILSYAKARILPISSEENLEDFFINRFGKELYSIFFKDYTEKVWGTSCREIPSTWGKQRIKSLNISKIILHYIKNRFQSKSLSQKNTETSLIEKFLYPKYGPGNLWTNVAHKIIEQGGIIYKNQHVVAFENNNFTIQNVIIKDSLNTTKVITGDYFISTMPVKSLINSFQTKVPQQIKTIADGLLYRDFITIGLLVNKLKINNGNLIDDNWIYIQEKKVKLGRLQVFNNWSPFLVKDNTKVWLGLEYFCNEDDMLWKMNDDEFIKFAIKELAEINIIESNEVIDATIIRVKKAYPSYFGSYPKFDELKNYLNNYENLFLIGRNGMHKYNNQDHSMLTAIEAVKNIKNNIKTKENIWSINTEEDYHETKINKEPKD